MSDKIILIGELENILHSKAFYLVLEERKSSLQNEVNSYIKQQDWFNAYATVAKIGDLYKTREMLQKKLEDLKKKDDE